MNKADITLEQLKLLQKSQKAKATRPAEKVIEEACEVIIAYVEGGQGLKGEKADLLFALLDWAKDNHRAIYEWEEKMARRGRAPTPGQQKYIDNME